MPAPVISVAQMREWEKATWSAGRTESEVISRVGHIVSHRARQLTSPGDLILVLAGKGHNGDDARHASQSLADREIYLINVADPESGRQEFQAQLSLQPSLIIDGLFGIGLNRALDSAWIRFVDEINAARIPVLSIDVPSGLNANSGEPQGAAIRAAVTLTLAAPKRGLLASTAWPYVGRLEVAPDIGLIPCPLRSDVHWTLREDFLNYPPARPVEGHKGTFGHLVVIGGSLGYHGAAVLATRAALRARPGLTTLFTREEVYVPAASQLRSAMVHIWRPPTRLPGSCTAVLLGPGLADPHLPGECKDEIRHFWQELPIPVICDASALDWLPTGSRPSTALRVATPHPGEAARLLHSTPAAVQADRRKALHELSKRFGGAWIVLKGHQTLIGRHTGDLFVNSSGNPLLAQGGSGDILAGYLGGLLAQPQLQSDPLTAIRYGVWQHGATADLLATKQRNWILDDLLDHLGCAT